MVTRARAGVFRPNLRYAHDYAYLTTTHADMLLVPRSVRSVVRDPNWLVAMREEFAALLGNHTWELVPRTPRANVITGKWIFQHKTHADGSLERYRARWVVRGFTACQCRLR